MGAGHCAPTRGRAQPAPAGLRRRRPSTRRRRGRRPARGCGRRACGLRVVRDQKEVAVPEEAVDQLVNGRERARVRVADQRRLVDQQHAQLPLVQEQPREVQVLQVHVENRDGRRVELLGMLLAALALVLPRLLEHHVQRARTGQTANVAPHAARVERVPNRDVVPLVARVHVVAHRPVHEQRRAVRDVPDGVAVLHGGKKGNVDAVQLNRALQQLYCAGERGQERAFAGACPAHDADVLAWREDHVPARHGHARRAHVGAHRRAALLGRLFQELQQGRHQVGEDEGEAEQADPHVAPRHRRRVEELGTLVGVQVTQKLRHGDPLPPGRADDAGTRDRLADDRAQRGAGAKHGSHVLPAATLIKHSSALPGHGQIVADYDDVGQKQHDGQRDAGPPVQHEHRHDRHGGVQHHCCRVREAAENVVVDVRLVGGEAVVDDPDAHTADHRPRRAQDSAERGLVRGARRLERAQRLDEADAEADDHLQRVEERVDVVVVQLRPHAGVVGLGEQIQVVGVRHALGARERAPAGLNHHAPAPNDLVAGDAEENRHKRQDDHHQHRGNPNVVKYPHEVAQLQRALRLVAVDQLRRRILEGGSIGRRSQVGVALGVNVNLVCIGRQPAGGGRNRHVALLDDHDYAGTHQQTARTEQGGEDTQGEDGVQHREKVVEAVQRVRRVVDVVGVHHLVVQAARQRQAHTLPRAEALAALIQRAQVTLLPGGEVDIEARGVDHGVVDRGVHHVPEQDALAHGPHWDPRFLRDVADWQVHFPRNHAHGACGESVERRANIPHSNWRSPKMAPNRLVLPDPGGPIRNVTSLPRNVRLTFSSTGSEFQAKEASVNCTTCGSLSTVMDSRERTKDQFGSSKLTWALEIERDDSMGEGALQTAAGQRGLHVVVDVRRQALQRSDEVVERVKQRKREALVEVHADEYGGLGLRRYHENEQGHQAEVAKVLQNDLRLEQPEIHAAHVFLQQHRALAVAQEHDQNADANQPERMHGDPAHLLVQPQAQHKHLQRHVQKVHHA
ncbi:mannose-1-phosphate guanylyltransferase/mannose-6-phosphate isomerase [Babesia caballi]|uniref:Mannose-1-phosphate guanylyltransferase/mannose-6-phosphate isomerase n=1 Tax=Babesia caballi TaxID=5871 RepID=A0AAV4LV12_BABCB|nr:mannose-1-phosphate guanylyltransferase/mannose-6-phosphate isomerase [Babesia caballi]